MVNEFRTLLLNVSDPSDTSTFIPAGFTARALGEPRDAVYTILFPVGLTLDQQLARVQAYLELITSAGLEEAFCLQDPRITYNLQTDFDNFKTAGLDFLGLYTTLVQNSGLINKLLTLPSRFITTKYDNLWLGHTNPVYRVAGLLVAYVLRLS